MPTTIYDSSLLTQRRQYKAQSGNFINRIQNPARPTTGYAPLLGIYDQSAINHVKSGQMRFYQRNEGCTSINNGCPCGDINAVDASGNKIIAGCCNTN